MQTRLRILTAIIGSLILSACTTVAPAQAALQPPAQQTAPCGSAYRDYNCDGNPDLLVKDSHDTLWLYPGDGDGGFLPRVKSATGWHYNLTLAGYAGGGIWNNGVYARDRSGTLWAIPGNGHGGWLKPRRIGGGWNQMTSIIFVGGDGNGLLAIDRHGALWNYPIAFQRLSNGDTRATYSPRLLAGTGWYGMMLIQIAFTRGNPGFHARDIHGTLWAYYLDWQGASRFAGNFGTGYGRYTNIIEDGDFVNVDGSFDFITTDVHGNLWLIASETGWRNRVKIGHGFTGYTTY